MKGKNILIVILIIIIIGLIGFICYDKGVFKKQNKGTNTEEITKEEKGTKLDLDDKVVKNLITSIRTFEEITYSNEKISNETMTSENKIAYAIEEEVIQKKNIETSKTPSSTMDDAYMSFVDWGVIKDRIKLMFGKNTRFERVSRLSLAIPSVGCYDVQYDYCTEENEDKCSFALDPFGCDAGWRFDKYDVRNTKATKYSDRIELERQVLHIQCNPETNECDLTSPFNEEKKIGTLKGNINDIDPDAYFSKADTIKYIFKLEDNHYYFESSELVK